MQEERQNIINRLKRIEGQVKGVIKMIEEEKNCSQILAQIAAVRAAMNKVGTIVFETHFRACLESAIREKNSDFLEEVIDMLGKYIT